MANVVKLTRKPQRFRGPTGKGNKWGCSPKILAQKLGLSERTIRKAIEMGEVKTATFGGMIWVPWIEFERLEKLFDVDGSA